MAVSMSRSNASGISIPKNVSRVLDAWSPSTNISIGPQQAEPPRSAGTTESKPVALFVLHSCGCRKPVIEKAMFIPTSAAIRPPINKLSGESMRVMKGVEITASPSK